MELVGDFGVDGGEFLAMTAPWGVELDQDVGELLGDFGEVCVLED